MATSTVLSPDERKRQYDRDRYTRLKQAREAAAPPDPITLLTPVDLAYLAGLIDGDGSIFVMSGGPATRRSLYPVVCLVMTYEPVVRWFGETLAAGAVQIHGSSRAERPAHYKPQHRSMLTGKRARLLCEQLLPYLRVKHEQARLVTTFPVDARIAPGVKIEASAIDAERRRLRDLINGLNH